MMGGLCRFATVGAFVAGRHCHDLGWQSCRRCLLAQLVGGNHANEDDDEAGGKNAEGQIAEKGF